MTKTRRRTHSPRTAKGNPAVLPELLNQIAIADVLGVSTRQVRNLEGRGLPIDESTGEKLYPKRQCQRWYVSFKQDEALSRIQQEGTTDLEEAQRRKMLAEARLAEIKVVREEGRLVPVEVHEAVIAEVADRLRAVLLSAPSNHAITLERAGVDPATAQEALEKVSEDLIRALRGVAEDIEADDGDDNPAD